MSMAVGRFFDIGAAIVAVAGITAFVTSQYTSDIIKAFGSAFSGSISSALGK